VRGEIDYEAQAAIELEMLAPNRLDKSNEFYPFSILKDEGMKVVGLGELILSVVRDVRNQVPASMISLKFHRTMAQIITDMCRVIARESGLNKVVLSGGVFQNRLLLKLANAALREAGFRVLTHHLVPCNDGGISLGQAVIANYIKS
jgi:hydrogenase maturation protein HypF